MYSLLAVPLVLAISNAQYIVTTSVDSAGNTYWSPTAGAPKTSVRALPSVPTLTYNCAIVPALCLNVAQLRPGAENGGHNEVFGWDPDKMRKIRRREKACPSNWKKKTICPASNQPPIHPLGITSEVPPHVDAEDFAVLRKTVNGNEERTGIMMSCDEFPPAMAIQGGIGIKGAPRNGVTYCAPSKFCTISCLASSRVDLDRNVTTPKQDQ